MKVFSPGILLGLPFATSPRSGHLKGETSFFGHRHLPFFVARVREGVPRSPCALVSARPHPQAVAQDRRDTVALRRAALPWRACDGTRQVTCAWLRAVHRSWSCSEPTATSGVKLFSLAAEPARFYPVKSRNAAKPAANPRYIQQTY